MESVNVGGVQVALPPNAADLELEDLKTTDGAAITIRCGKVGAEIISETIQTLPGDRPQAGIEEVRGAEEKEEDEESKQENAARAVLMVARSVRLIEAAGSLVLADGNLAHPAFGADAIPVAALSMNDAAQIVATTLKVNGVWGKAVTRARFRHDWGSGLVNGAGDGRSLSGLRTEPALVSEQPGSPGGGSDVPSDGVASNAD